MIRWTSSLSIDTTANDSRRAGVKTQHNPQPTSRQQGKGFPCHAVTQIPSFLICLSSQRPRYFLEKFTQSTFKRRGEGREMDSEQLSPVPRRHPSRSLGLGAVLADWVHTALPDRRSKIILQIEAVQTTTLLHPSSRLKHTPRSQQSLFSFILLFLLSPSSSFSTHTTLSSQPSSLSRSPSFY